MGMPGGGGLITWCPVSRLGVQPGVWLYTWMDCATAATSSKISMSNFLPMGCPGPSNPSGSPFCQANLPLAIASTSGTTATDSRVVELTDEPTVLTDNDEPLAIYVAGIEDDSLLREF